MVLPIRRSHLKGKMRRKMMRQGVPRDLANKSAKVYLKFLRDLTSIKGIKNTIDQYRNLNAEEIRELTKNKTVETNNTNTPLII
jgi:hypothetical protein